jgi:hypothetical protein
LKILLEPDLMSSGCQTASGTHWHWQWQWQKSS